MSDLLTATVLVLMLSAVWVEVGCASVGSAGGRQPSNTPLDRPDASAVDAATAHAPVADWSDLRVFRRAMKPGEEAIVSRFADANRYVIVASLTLDTRAIIRGAERVRFTNRTSIPLSSVVFRLYPNTAVLMSRMDVTNVSVQGHPAEPVFSQRASVMTLPLRLPLRPRASLEITMDFTVTMTTGVDVSYGRFGYKHGVVSATAWYPTLSVYDEGLGWWDAVPSPEGDPAYTETGLYDVRVTAPADVKVAMSGTEVATVRNRDGTVTHHDVTGPMRDHAFEASTRYAVVSSVEDGVQVNVWHYKDQTNPQMHATADVLAFARQALHTYDAVYGPYPFREFDVVENPTPTGVEYPGLVQIAEDEWETGTGELERTVAHETGHQWFYSLVGNDQVNHPWLDEGLTSYTEFVYMRAVHPAQADAYVAMEQAAYEAYLRNGGADLPVDLPVGRYSVDEYSAVVYTKSALFLVHLERELGRETVLKALSTYLERYEYQVARSQDLERVFEDVSGRDCTAEFHVWVGI